MPQDAFAATALEMLAGGIFLLPIGLLATDFEPSEWSTKSILVVVVPRRVRLAPRLHRVSSGCCTTRRSSKVATYAYVNPVVAITLGVIVLDEALSWRLVLGAAIVLVAVAAVVRKESVPAETEAAAAGAARVPD